MNHALSVDEFGLLNFFGALPLQRDNDVPWVYNDTAYEVTVGQTQVSFAVAPADRDVRIRLQVSGIVLYELNAMGVQDVRLHDDKGREWLEVIISQGQSIRLRIAPQISISESLERPPVGRVPARIGVSMNPINDVADAEKRIQAHAGAPEEFTLPISNSLLDPVGVNMAIITDGILARGWEPDGFVQHEEYRLFRYKAANTQTP